MINVFPHLISCIVKQKLETQSSKQKTKKDMSFVLRFSN